MVTRNFNDSIVREAEQLAKTAGGVWHDHLSAARRNIELVRGGRAKAPATTIQEAALRKRGLVREFEHQLKGEGMVVRKSSNIVIDAVDIGNGKTVRVVDDREQRGIAIAGVNILVDELPDRLLAPFWDASTKFAIAKTDDEQRVARLAIELVVRQILKRNKYLEAKVRERMGRTPNAR